MSNSNWHLWDRGMSFDGSQHELWKLVADKHPGIFYEKFQYRPDITYLFRDFLKTSYNDNLVIVSKKISENKFTTSKPYTPYEDCLDTGNTFHILMDNKRYIAYTQLLKDQPSLVDDFVEKQKQL